MAAIAYRAGDDVCQLAALSDSNRDALCGPEIFLKIQLSVGTSSYGYYEFGS